MLTHATIVQPCAILPALTGSHRASANIRRVGRLHGEPMLSKHFFFRGFSGICVASTCSAWLARKRTSSQISGQTRHRIGRHLVARPATNTNPEGGRPRGKPLRVVIVGAGPGGLALACSLAGVPGLEVKVLEGRSRDRTGTGGARSHSIGLGRRAREAVIAVGGEALWERLAASGMTAGGFTLHLNGVGVNLPPPEGEPVVLVDRWEICNVLAKHLGTVACAEGTSISVEHGVKVSSVNLVDRTLLISSTAKSGNPSEHDPATDEECRYDLLIGANGVRSCVRQAMSSQLPRKSFESEVQTKPGRWQVLHMELPPTFAPTSVHAMVSSKAPFGLFCIPSVAGKHCVIVSWSTSETPKELLAAKTPEEFEKVMLDNFPSLVQVPREAAENFLSQRPSTAVVSRCRPLHNNENAVCVLGDAAHAVGGGSLGQGCSAALQDAAALGSCLQEALCTGQEDLEDVVQDALDCFSDDRSAEGWALLDLIELQSAGELRAGALIQGPVVLGFFLEQLGRGSLRPLADLGARFMKARLETSQPLEHQNPLRQIGLLHEKVVIDTWTGLFDKVSSSVGPDMQTALMATDEPYSQLVDRNLPWLTLLQSAKAAFGGSQMSSVRKIPALKNLNEVQLANWAAAFSTEEKLAGDVILRQSSLARNFFVISRGTCMVLCNGNEVVELGPGAHFGSVALLLGVPSSTSLIAKTDVTLLQIPGKIFHRLVEQAGPEFEASLAKPAENFQLGPTTVAAVQEEGRIRARSLLQECVDLDVDSLDELLGTSGCEIYMEGEVVTLCEREQVRLLESGTCSVVRSSKEVRVLHPGDVFGPDLKPGEEVVARTDNVFVCRFTHDGASVLLDSMYSENLVA